MVEGILSELEEIDQGAYGTVSQGSMNDWPNLERSIRNCGV